MESSGRFNEKATLYRSYRPDYPERCISFLQDELRLSEQTTIADIGAGTGIFTKQLLRTGAVVTAVEPNEEMRAQAEQYLKPYSCKILNGTAEHTGLPSQSVDLVTAAQAFHWFDVDAFQAECRRILKPGGTVLLIWNSRDESLPLLQSCTEVLKRFCPKFHGYSEGMGDGTDRFKRFFQNGRYHCKTFANPLIYDLDAFIGRHLSSSFALKPDDAEYKDFIQTLEEVFTRYETDKTVEYPYLTRCYWGKV